MYIITPKFYLWRSSITRRGGREACHLLTRGIGGIGVRAILTSAALNRCRLISPSLYLFPNYFFQNNVFKIYLINCNRIGLYYFLFPFLSNSKYIDVTVTILNI